MSPSTRSLFLATLTLLLSITFISADLSECQYQIKTNGPFMGKWVNLNLLKNEKGYTVKDDSGWDNLINFCSPVGQTCTESPEPTMGIQTYQDGACNTLTAPFDGISSQVTIKEEPSASNDDPASNPPDIVLRVAGGNDGRSMQVTCHCKPGQKEPTITWINQVPQKQYNFRAFSEYCCASDDYAPGGLPFLFPVGILGIFLIIGIFVFALYWPIGAVINKFIRKKEGIEIIPNVAFWKALPFLFWAGITWLPQAVIGFIQRKRGGGGGGSYEEA